MAEATITTVAGIVGGSLFDVAKRKISYIWNYTENVKKLKNETEKLKIMRRAVDEVDADITKVEEFLGEANLSCFGMCCSNWCNLYHHGKTTT
ncbi:hypothetical protein Tco_1441689 [Tanacetum coccineum]